MVVADWGNPLPADAVVMRPTGLLDANSVEIYEHDILELNEDDFIFRDFSRRYCLVGFRDGAFMTGRSHDPYYLNTYLWLISKESQIVGNLYQTPGLLVQGLPSL